MPEPELAKQQIAHCPAHHTRMRATIREGWFRCTTCRALWVMPEETETDGAKGQNPARSEGMTVMA